MYKKNEFSIFAREMVQALQLDCKMCGNVMTYHTMDNYYNCSDYWDCNYKLFSTDEKFQLMKELIFSEEKNNKQEFYQ